MLYPQQNDVRNRLDLSGFWDFKLDPEEVGESQGWFDGLSESRRIAVPGSWNEQFEDAYNYLGMAWYVCDFYVPSGWKGQRVMIRVGSANYFARVWVNGIAVGEHEGGHLPFAFDVTEHVRWGEPNTIAIQMENELKPSRVPPGNMPGGIMSLMRGFPATSFDFFPYAGLHRPVILYAVPPTHIDDVTVTTEIDGERGTVHVRVIQQGTARHGEVILEGEGDPMTADLAFENGTAETTLTVPDARLWSPDDPYLYTLTVTLTEDGAVIDRYTLEIGIRTVEVRGDELLLNGKPIQLRGFGRHEDFYVSGRGLNEPLIVRDYGLMKWVGANSYRTSHYPYSEAEMRMADREGMLIIDETPAVGLAFTDDETDIEARLAQCQAQVRELIARDKNHPAVIMWSVANEPMPPNMLAALTGQETPPVDPSTTDFLRTLHELARELDPTRPVTHAGMHGSPVEWLELADVVCINRYYGWYTQPGHPVQGAALLEDELDELHETLQRPMVISEFGTGTIAGQHSHPAKMWTEEYQVSFLRNYLDVADRRDFVIGTHVWNFADFQTGQGTNRAASMNLKGVFTRAREPKMAAHMLRARWRESEV
jgi:beta-glucuronidase